MDKLEKSRQSEIRKMADVRLHSKLLQAGVTLDELETMDRSAMLDRYAELVLAGKEPEAGTPVVASKAVSYDPELEKQRLIFQMKQWEEDRLERDLQRKLDAARFEAERAEREARWEAEKAEREARFEAEKAEKEAARAEREARFEAEKAEKEAARAEREAEKEYRQAQLELQQKQIKLLEDKEKSEKDRDDGQVAQLKRYGDALRNSITKLGVEPIELIAFFDNLERQFKELKVPDNLRVALMKPFLNDRARLLVSRVEDSRSADFHFVKGFLLKEFRLVSQQFLENFNSSVRQSQETFKAYVTRLSMLLDYYLNSRGVTDFAALKQLLVSDRVKTSLSDGMLNHVLRTEVSLPRTYAMPDELADILDKYCANFDQNGRPRVSAIGIGPRRQISSQGNARAATVVSSG